MRHFLEVLYIRLITTWRIAFRMVEVEESRALLLYLNPPIEQLPTILSSYDTYTAKEVRIQQKVQSALSNIYFTLDLWSSPNSLQL
jgi:hypothetical protein